MPLSKTQIIELKNQLKEFKRRIEYGEGSNIVGLDQSLTSTGYIVLDVKGKLINDGMITPKSSGAKRLNDIYLSLNRIIHVYKPLLVVKEGYAFARAQGAHQIGEGGGVAKLLFYRKQIPLIIIAPPTLKKFVTGKGQGEKNVILMHVFKKWKYEAKNDDLADAYGLAKIGMALYHKFKDNKNSKIKYEQEIINNIINPILKKRKKRKGRLS